MGIDPKAAPTDREDERTGCSRKPLEAARREKTRRFRPEWIPIGRSLHLFEVHFFVQEGLRAFRAKSHRALKKTIKPLSV